MDGIVIMQGLLGMLMLVVGGARLAGVGPFVAEFARFRYPPWFHWVTGGVEVIGGLSMLIGIAIPALGVLAGGWLAATMVGAVWTHLVRAHDPITKVVPAVVVLVLALAVAALRLPALQAVLMA